MKFNLSYGSLVRWAVTLISVAMAIYHIWAIALGTPEAVWFRGTHLIFALTLLFLIYRSSGSTDGNPTVSDLVLLALSLAPIFYLFINYEYIITRIFYVDDLTTLDMIMGTLLTVMVMEATRRVIGLALPLTAVVFILYGLFIANLDVMRMLDQLYMTTEGIFGITLSVSAAYVHDLCAVRQLHGTHRHRPAVHGFRHEPDRPHGGRPGQGVLRQLSAVRHHLRQRRRQRDGRWADHHSADETIRLPWRISRLAWKLSPQPAARSCRQSWARRPSSWRNFWASPTARW